MRDLWTFSTGGVIASAAYLLGGIDNLIVAFTILMACDFVTGILAARFHEGIQSNRAMKGIGKKVGMLSFVILANQLDIVTGNTEGFLRDAMLLFLIATEGISIIENIGRMGIEVPPFLSSALERLKGAGEDIK